MSGFGPPRFPQHQSGHFSYQNPRFPPLNSPPQQFGSYHHSQGPSGYQVEPRFSGPYGNERPYYRGRGRGRQGYRGNRGNNRSHGRGQLGVEAYYKHSMVEDPWRELEQIHKKQSSEKDED